ncbi:aldo/keto reductase [Litorilinea aerophila]|uniref:Aldo/keto reductase n=1 Tax=Litorilinea aerophila TaxID=1204385 RepID=A0A540VJY7_9CHLR|nr:aldo/keto reductase [Litorilinea aerophila]MCC9075503.1 aldo/keto reductase [Litorilinea aerophila]OUC05557.1 aldo/keto reductase [Litorilinea aerophila]GIV76388.1 MAG: aldo/keto reductase [Litorilinea sp.]
MEYRSLGRTAVKVSPLCLGCMMFGGRTSPEDSYAIIDRALDAGINFLDTANVYSRGRSEEVVGEALKRNGKRHRVILATKVHGRMDDDDPNAAGSSRRHIIEQCEASLRRLQTDYIDLYQIHRPRSDTPIDETLRALDDLIRAGKVRYIGTSTFAAWQVMEALWVSKELGLNRFVTEQPPYHILDRRIERELIPMAQTYGIGIIPWSPLAGGLLTGKYTRENPSPEGARYANVEDNPRLARRKTDELYDVVEGLQPLAQAKGCTLAQLALAWCMHQPGITSPIIGPRTMEQLEDNLGALEVTITDEDRAAIDRLVPPGRMVSPFYEADFGPHQFRW